MKFNLLIIILSSFFLLSCEHYESNSSKNFKKKIERKYRNSGFTLVYSDQLDIKKLDNRSLSIFHPTLKRKSFVKITNPENNKSLIAEVKFNNAKFSNFYNSVITTRIAETLELDLKEPFIEIILISQNSTFVAKKAKTFDEEKNVAEKAPVDGIKIADLNNRLSKTKKIKTNNNFSYSIKIADFYYKKTAQLIIDRIENETSQRNSKIIQLSKTNYRVLIGPFNDIYSLKKSFEKIKSLYFENLEIIKNV
tara:strand:- start:1268 stop:2020 length:753 start_codon:yes stop_codon:yes gene_type:complete